MQFNYKEKQEMTDIMTVTSGESIGVQIRNGYMDWDEVLITFSFLTLVPGYMGVFFIKTC